jgi:hypothetical protein
MQLLQMNPMAPMVEGKSIVCTDKVGTKHCIGDDHALCTVPEVQMQNPENM